tara:strand:+ start:3842 stop:5512 length:1671 start_codon:yes stop_codon:yes gene_type:complete
MAKAQKFIDDIITEIKEKKQQRESLLDQLSLADVEIDQLDELIVNIDKDIPPLIEQINTKIQAHVDAYEARIEAGCKSDLEWVFIGTVDWGDEDADEYEAKFVGITTGYYSVKYYQSPKDRDYGSNLITSLRGNIGLGETVLAVIGGTEDSGYRNIQIGDEITDDLEAPEIFPIGTFPKVVGFGRTDTNSGISTTLSGYIAIGSSELYNTGIGTNQDIPILSGIAYTNYLPYNTKVVGFGNTQISVKVQKPDPSDSNKVKEFTVSKTVTAYILSNAAVGTAHSGSTFQVGLTTNVPSIILGTACTTTNGDGRDYYVIRSEADVDEAFDFNKFPNDPVRVGNISSGKVGLGHSAVLVDDSSEYTTYPTGPFTWWSNRMVSFPQGLPGRAIREFKNGSDPFDEATLTLHPEPKQGGGSIRVPIGVDTWPCLVDDDGDVESPISDSRYITEGTRVFVQGGSGSLGTTNDTPASPSPSNCAALKTAIDTAEAEMAAIKAENEPQIRKLVAMTATLRDYRNDKQIRAWGYLQGASYLRGEITKLEKYLAEIKGEDFSNYES